MIANVSMNMTQLTETLRYAKVEVRTSNYPLICLKEWSSNN